MDRPTSKVSKVVVKGPLAPVLILSIIVVALFLAGHRLRIAPP